MDLTNPWKLIPFKVLRNNFYGGQKKFITLSHHPTKCGHMLCGSGDMFLVCDVTWPRNHRVMWLSRWGVLKRWVNEGCWTIFLVSGGERWEESIWENGSG